MAVPKTARPSHTRTTTFRKSEMQRRKIMSISVRIGIAVLATAFAALIATTRVEEVFAFASPARPTTTAVAEPAAQAPAGKVVEVKVDNFSFSPQTITI